MRASSLATLTIAVCAGLLAARPSFAYTTPEDAVAAYIDGVTERDMEAVLASTAIDNMSKGYDFVSQVDRIESMSILIPMPKDEELFNEINKLSFEARIAGQVKILIYGLMTTNEFIDGKIVKMDAAGASELATVFRADRLKNIKLVKVGIPSPAVLNSERYQVMAVQMSKIYGAETSTERVALISFEGLNFALGFSLVRYGDDWLVRSQDSPIGGFVATGLPKRMTPEEFENMLK